MQDTRVSIFVAICCALAMPVIALAAASAASTAQMVKPNPKPGMNEAAKQCILKIFQQQTSATSGKSTTKQSQKATKSIDDNCTDETVSIDSSGKQTIQQTGREGGKNDINDPAQCIANSCSASACGMVTYSMPGSSIVKKVSKCSEEYKKLSGSGGTDASMLKNLGIQSVAQQAVGSIDPSTDAGKAALSQALQNLGESKSSADAAVSTDSGAQKTKDLLSSLASGDTDTAKADAQALNLNSDTIDKISSIQPSGLPSVLKGAVSSQDQSNLDNVASASDTFSQDSSQGSGNGAARGGVYADRFAQIEQSDGIPKNFLANTALVESGGNAIGCHGSGTNMVCGMFQYTQSTWAIDSQRWNNDVNGINSPLPYNSALDPTTAATVLGHTSAYYEQQYASSIQGAVAQGMPEGTALYMIHNLGTGGGVSFLNAYAQNPNASVNSAVPQWEINGNTGYYGDGSMSLAQAAQNVTNKLNGGSADFTGSAVAANVSSPVSVITGSGYENTSYITTGSSPFANVTPTYSNISTVSGSGYSSGYSGYSSIPVSYTSSNTSGTSYTSGTTYKSAYTPTTLMTTQTTTGTNTTTSTAVNQHPAAQIIVQPATISAGNAVMLAWSSVGMGNLSVCSVMEDGAIALSSANSGSKSVTLASKGNHTFSITCNPPAGTTISQVVTVAVQ